MTAHFWCDLLQFLRGFDAVAKLEPALRSIKVALVVRLKGFDHVVATGRGCWLQSLRPPALGKIEDQQR